MGRLRRLADHARTRSVTVCMETHPPFGANADAAAATIGDVGSEGLRYNFDTANIYYYNDGADTVSELAKIVALVASVHLKDTDGGYHSPNFPELGRGVVDFPGVFELLGRHGFRGPYTMEVEGANVQGVDAAGRLAFLRRCMDYLRSIGAAE